MINCSEFKTSHTWTIAGHNKDMKDSDIGKGGIGIIHPPLYRLEKFSMIDIT